MAAGVARVDDVVVGLLALVRASECTFTADREFLHRAFSALKVGFEAPLASLTFRSKGAFPESLDLDQALCNLEAAGLLHRKNQAPRFYEIDAVVPEAYARFAHRRLESLGIDDATMQSMASRLRELLGTQASAAG